MDNHRIPDDIRSFIEPLVSPPIRACLQADRQYIDAAGARIQELEQECAYLQHERDNLSSTLTALQSVMQAKEAAIRSLQKRLEEAAPSDYELDIGQVYSSAQSGPYVMAPESVVVEATKRLRIRFDVDFADLLEAEYRLQMDEASRS